MDEYTIEKIKLIKESNNDEDELEYIIDQIYEDGFDDGYNDGYSKKESDEEGLPCLFGTENGIKKVHLKLSEQAKRELENLKKELNLPEIADKIRC